MCGFFNLKLLSLNFFKYNFLDFSQGKPPVKTIGLRRPIIPPTKSVVNVIKKFDQLDKQPISLRQNKKEIVPSVVPCSVRLPSPSLTRKTLSFMAKEQQGNENKRTEREKHGGKSESFRKAAAFWNKQKEI